MQNFYPDFIQNTFSRSVSLLIAAALVILVGCADGTDTTTTTATTGSGGVTGTATLAVTLSTNSLSAATSSTVTATLQDADGIAISGEVVTFVTDSSFGTLDRATALTSPAGVAIVTLSQSASAPINGGAASVDVSAAGVFVAAGYSVSGGGGGGGGVVGQPTLTITPFANALVQGTPVQITAQVTDASTAPVANTVVTFTLGDVNLATLSPASGTALTDASGNATVSLSAVSLTSGATDLRASAVVGTITVSDSYGLSVGQSSVTISNMVFGVGAAPLSAFGNTSVSIDVFVNGVLTTTPLTVDFTSICATNGTAVISSTAVTSAGTATGSYRDSGCAGTDIITASISGGSAALAGNLVVTAPTVGSLQYVSAAPTNIALKGIGGIETSQVTFKVLDAAGNPLSGHSVSFALSTGVGGITLIPASATAISDSEGLVVTTVNSGTVSTPVRVTATDGVRNTQSNELTISTGIPDQDSFSLSVSEHNIEGWDIDGTTSILTARLSDHFNNPVPDGTAINFTAEGGSIESSCTTIAGACSVTFTSQEPRPTNGRVTVLAFAVGEESFTDLNGSGLADSGELIDANGQSTDMGEAYVDYNENGTFEDGTPPGTIKEHLFDFDGDSLYDVPDGQFNGVLCNTSGICSPTKTIHVRQSQVISLSSSAIEVSLFSDSALTLSVNQVDLLSCNSLPAVDADNTQPIKTIYVRALDVNGNAPPVGTTITLSTTNGTILGGGTIVIGDTTGCSSTKPGCPASVGTADFNGTDIPGGTAVVLQSDATFKNSVCTNDVHTGLLTVSIGGSSAFYSITD